MYEEYVSSNGMERFRYSCPFSRFRILSFMAVWLKQAPPVYFFVVIEIITEKACFFHAKAHGNLKLIHFIARIYIAFARTAEDRRFLRRSLFSALHRDCASMTAALLHDNLLIDAFLQFLDM